MNMRITSLLLLLLALTMVACGGPSAPESPDSSSYGQTFEGETPEGRNPVEDDEE